MAEVVLALIVARVQIGLAQRHGGGVIASCEGMVHGAAR
jgi:hypothetical protein